MDIAQGGYCYGDPKKNIMKKKNKGEEKTDIVASKKHDRQHETKCKRRLEGLKVFNNK